VRSNHAYSRDVLMRHIETGSSGDWQRGCDCLIAELSPQIVDTLQN